MSLVPLGEARGWVVDRCSPLPAGPLAPGRALRHVLATDVVSGITLPAFDNSAMDGFAVRSGDCGAGAVDLKVVGTLLAGHGLAPADGAPLAGGDLEPGTAVRIMTGAPVPPGADAVCPVEETEVQGDVVTITAPAGVRPGAHVRPAGADVRPGDVLGVAGSVVGVAQVGLLEAAGCATVDCYRRPRVGVLSTGDELLPGADGGIRDSNRAALLAALDVDAFAAVDLGVVADRQAAVAAAVLDAAGSCDAVVTTGGVSVGDRDVVRQMLSELPTVAHRWMQVAVKPAKPFAFALLDTPGGPVPLFGLPGNPVSALVSYELFARPALRRMAGHRRWWRPSTEAVAGIDFRRRADGKTHLVPSVARREGPAVVVRPCPHQGSHLLTSLTPANSLAVVPDGGTLAEGSLLRAWLLDADSLFEEAP